MVSGSHIRKGAKWATLRVAIDAAIQLATWVFLSRWLPPFMLGLVSLVGVILSVVGVVCGHSMGAALVQRRTLDDMHRATVFFGITTASILATVCVGLGASAIGRLLHEAELVKLLWALTPTLVLRALTIVPEAELTRRLDFESLARAQIASGVAGALVGISSAVLGAGIWSLVAQQWVSAIVSSVFVWRSANWKPSGRPSERAARDLWQFYGPLWAVDWLNLGKSRADRYVVELTLGPAGLAFYALAHRIVDSCTLWVVSILGQIAFPIFARVRDNRAEFQRLYLKAVHWICAGAFPVSFALWAVAPSAIRIVFGEKWIPAGAALRWLAPVLACRPFFQLHAGLFLAEGKSRLRLWLIFIQTVASLALYLWWYRAGLSGIAAAFTVGILFVIPINIAFALRSLGLSLTEWLTALRVPFAGTAALGVAWWAAVREGIAIDSTWKLLAAGAGGTVIYGAVLLAFDGDIRQTLSGWGSQLIRGRGAAPRA